MTENHHVDTDDSPAPTEEPGRGVGASAAWNLLQYGGSKVVTFLATMVLARLLAPEAFGLVALALLAVNVFDRIKDLGVGQALVQQPGQWPRFAPTGATLSVLGAVGFAAVAALFAGPIADLLGDHALTPIVQGLALWLLIAGLTTFPDAALRRAMAFKERTLPEFAGTLIKAVAQVSLALLGYGVWSLVWGQVAASAVTCVAYWWIYLRRHASKLAAAPVGGATATASAASAPSTFGWDRDQAGRLMRFGASLSGVGLLTLVLDNIDYFVIGRRLGAEQLGYYTMAFRLPELLVTGVCAMISQVLFSSFSRMQDDEAGLRRHFLSATTTVTCIAVPISLGLSAAAEPITAVVLGPEYAPSVDILTVLGLYTAIYALSFTSGDVYKAMGRADILVKLSLVKVACFIPVLWWAAGYGTVAVAWGLVALHSFFALVRLVIVHRVLHLSVADQWSALWPCLLAGATLYGAVALVAHLVNVPSGTSGLPAVALLLLEVIVGIGAYALTLRVASPRVFAGLLTFARRG